MGVGNGIKHFNFIMKGSVVSVLMNPFGLILAQQSVLKEATFTTYAPYQSFAEDTS